jgi:hypothetical protein
MNIIYIVMRHQGSYDDYSETMVKGFACEEAANEYILILQEKDKRYNAIIRTLYDAYREWLKENPFPAMEPHETVPRLPKGTKPKDITPEHKREAGRIQRENVNKRARHEAEKIVNEHRVKAFCEDLLIKHVPEEDHDEFTTPFYIGSQREYDYSVQELEVQ